MTISYDEARQLVRRTLEPDWPNGTFCLDDREIVEDDQIYVFNVGARELLVDGDESYEIYGAAIPTVNKKDGSLKWIPGHLLYDEDPNLRRRRNPNRTLQL